MFRFTIRDLLWLILAASLLAYCYSERARLAKLSAAIAAERLALAAERLADKKALEERLTLLMKIEPALQRTKEADAKKYEQLMLDYKERYELLLNKLKEGPEFPDEAKPGVYFLK